MFKKCLDCVKNIKLDKVAVFAGGLSGGAFPSFYGKGGCFCGGRKRSGA